MFGLPLMICAVGVSLFFVLPLVALMLSVGIYLMSLRCPGCGHPVGKQWGVWTPFPPKKCTACGAFFD
jgi:hypothetical protein